MKRIHRGKCVLCGKHRFLNKVNKCFWCFDKTFKEGIK